MARYTGAPCPVCNEIFKENSDIVVCPICGAPHHRECYRSEGNRALAVGHTEGKLWKRADEKSRALLPCPQCGVPHAPDAVVCENCGTAFFSSDSQQISPAPGAETQLGQQPYRAPGYNNQPPRYPTGAAANFTVNDTIDDLPINELASFIGPNSQYYLRQFEFMGRAPFFLSINFSAFLFNFSYFFFRKMYKVGFIYLASFLLIMLPAFVGALQFFSQIGPLDPNNLMPVAEMMEQFQNSDIFQQMYIYSVISQILYYIWWISAPLFANYLYYRHVVRSVNALRTSPHYASNPAGCLQARGGTAFTMVLVGVSIIFAFFMSYMIAVSYMII